MPAISVFDIFKIGIGPSSSHTVGPMKAARAFVTNLGPAAGEVASLGITLYGSLAHTGGGHGTDTAIVLGLAGYEPETVDPDAVPGILAGVQAAKRLELPGAGPVAFDPAADIVFEYGEELPRHTNGMRFVARDAAGSVVADDVYYSLGGGFIARGDEAEAVTGTGRTAVRLSQRRWPVAGSPQNRASPSPSSCIATSGNGAAPTKSNAISPRSGRRCGPASSAACIATACCPDAYRSGAAPRSCFAG